MDPGTIERDDLTAIKGIGSARQQWLNKAFHVYTFEGLAALSVDEIEVRLKAEGRIASHSEIQAWIDQARQLSATRQPLQSEMMTEAIDSAANSSMEGGDWKPFASFVVEFQVRTTETQSREYRTTAHHMEADSGAFWLDLRCEELCKWLRESIDKIEQPEIEASATFEAVDASPIEVAITQIRAFQPPYAARPLEDETDKSFPRIIKPDEPLMLEVDFNIAGMTESGISLSEKLLYSGQLQARNLTNGRKIQANLEPGKVEPGREHYTLRLPELSLQPGVYKIGILVKLDGVAPAINYLELPLVQVV